MTEEDLDEFLKFDVDGDQELDYHEFVAAVTRKEDLLNRENLEAAFKLFDLDNSGGIERDEL